MKRGDIINHLIDVFGFKSYLEIGLDNGIHYNSIKCEKKMGIEPDNKKYSGKTVYNTTSDVFFENLSESTKFDIVFIDGLHLEHQVDRDINNSISHLNKDGIIVIHDCNPPTVHHAREVNDDFSTPAGGKWNGTVWKSFVKLRCTREDFYMSVVDTDWGCGILIPGRSQSLFSDLSKEEVLEWDNFENNKKNILNLISTSEFLEKFKTKNGSEHDSEDYIDEWLLED